MFIKAFMVTVHPLNILVEPNKKNGRRKKLRERNNKRKKKKREKRST